MSNCVIITGASSGLGRELSKIYAAAGWFLIINGQDRRRLAETAEMCSRKPGDVLQCAGDLRDDSVLRELGFFAEMHHCKHLITSAALYHNCPFEKMAASSIEELLTVNAIAVMKTIRVVLPAMIDLRNGTIVGINSSAGKNAAVNETAYVASKHALTGFFKTLRFELRTSGVRVMDIFIGGMKTPMMKDRPDYNLLMDPVEVAQVIFQNVTNPIHSAQIEELSLGRFIFPLV